MKNFVNKIILTILACFFIFSCDVTIGLGKQIDTKDPIVSINGPKASSKVRSIFVMDGTWSDDLMISGINITLIDVNNSSAKYGPFPAEIVRAKQTEGSWSCKIEPVDSTGKKIIPDGTYTAYIEVEDSFKHKSTATQTFSIDNTAPVISLLSPSTIDMDNPASFGKIFSITGNYSDDSSIDTIEVQFYDAEGNEIPDANKSIAIKSTTIEENVALWTDSLEGDELSDLYKKIYGSEKSGSKKFYCSVVAYDKARKYPAEEGDKGNISDYFFLQNELEEYFSNSNESVKITTLYQILSGATSLRDVDESYTSWYNDLAASKQERVSLSLNPENNPTFTLSGYTTFVKGKAAADELDKLSPDGSAGLYEFKDKSKISITVSPGRDNYSLRKDSLGINLIECDVSGAPITKASGEYKNVVSVDVSDAVKAIGTSYTIETVLYSEDCPGLEVGKYYIVQVVGQDTKNNVVSNGADTYAIKYAMANATPPTIKITELNGATEKLNSTVIAKSSPVVVKGTVNYYADILTLNVYTQNPDDDNAKVVLTSGEIANSAVTAGISATKPVKSGQMYGTTFEFTLPKSEIEKISEDTFELYVVAELKQARVNNTATFQITNDKKDPVFSDDYSVVPESEIGEDKYVNGTITITTSVSDDITMNPSVSYSLDGGTTWSRAEKTKQPKFTFDTTKFTDKAEKVIQIRAVDDVGNKAIKSISLNVDQSTDAPVVSFSNANEEISSVAGIKANSENIFGTKSNNVILATITDDDGIEKITITFNGSRFERSAPEPEVITVGGKTSYSLKAVVPTVQGTYDVTIEVKDKKQEATGNNTTTKNFTIAVDNGAPELTITSANGAYQAANADIEIAGKVNDSNAEIQLVKLTYDAELNEVETPVENTAIWDAEHLNWKFAVRTTTEGEKYNVIASDIYGQKSVKEFEYLVDAYEPTFTIVTINGADYSELVTERYANKNNQYIIRGTVTDKKPGDADVNRYSSGLEDNIYFKILKASDAAPAKQSGKNAFEIDSTWEKAVISTDKDGNATWIANIDFSGDSYVEGNTYKVYFAARDIAKNVSLISKNPCDVISLTIDSVAPHVEIGDKAESGKLYIFARTTDNLDESDNSITGSGIKSVELLLNQTIQSLTAVKTAETVAGVDYDVYTFEVPQELLRSGVQNEYSIKIADKAGNSTTPTANSIDNSLPVIRLENKLSNNSRYNEYYYTNDSFKIPYSITASGNGLASVTWKENEEEEKSITLDMSAGNPKTCSSEITIAKPASSKKVENVFTAKNIYGGEKSESFYYIFDLKAPVISDVSLDTSTDVYYFDAGKSLLISGKAADNSPDAEIPELSSGLSEVVYYIIKGGHTEWNANWKKEDTEVVLWKESTIGTKDWKFKVEAEKYEEGSYTVFVEAIDNVGNKTMAPAIRLVADKSDPNVTFDTVNEFYKSTVTIAGKITESYLDSYKVVVKKDGAVVAAKAFDSPVKTFGQSGFAKEQSWNITLNPTTNGEGKYSVEISTKDKAGKTYATSFETTLDKTAPKLNVDATKLGAVLLKNIGEDTWYNSVDLSFTGYFEESLSGIKTVTYDINGSSSVIGTTPLTGDDKGKESFNSTFSGFNEGATNTLKLSWVDNAGNTDSRSWTIKVDKTIPEVSIATESPVLTNKTKPITVEGTVSDNASGIKEASLVYEIDRTEKSIPVTLKTGADAGKWDATFTIEQLKEFSNSGSYKVTLKAIDNAGNINNSNNFVLAVDSVAPATVIDSPAASKALNGKNTISGKVKDNNNVKSIKLYYYFTTAVAPVVPATLSGWKDLRLDGDGTTLVEKQVGGLYDGQTVELGDISNWRFDGVDLNACLSSGVVSGKLYLLPVAYDEAGNCNIDASNIKAQTSSQEGYVEYSLNLDSDRPIVKLTNLDWDSENNSGSEYLQYAQTLTGVLDDDDGIAELRIADSVTIPEDFLTNAGYKQKVNSGAFTYVFTTDPVTGSSDGLKNLWFYVKDTQGGEFITNKAHAISVSENNVTGRPYILFNGQNESDKQDFEGLLSFTKDSNPPQLSDLAFAYSSSNVVVPTTTLLSSNQINLVGGTKRKFVTLEAIGSDASGIESVTIHEDSLADDITLTRVAGGNIWRTSEPVDVSGWSEGQHTVTFTAKDNCGLEFSISRNITVDNTAPVAELKSPELSDEQTGIVTISGTATDDYSTPNVVKYLVLDDSYYNANGTVNESAVIAKLKNADYQPENEGTASYWKFKESALPTDIEGLSSYTKVPHTSGDIYTVKVYLYTEDNLGNAGLSEAAFTYNPFGNRPKVEITYPIGKYTNDASKNAAYHQNFVDDYKSLNGPVTITGSATDNDSMSSGKVFVQLDVDNDGKFTLRDRDILEAMTKEGGVPIYTVIKGTASIVGLVDSTSIRNEEFWGIEAIGTNSWRITVNSSAELTGDSLNNAASLANGEGTKDGKRSKIGVRAIAMDSEGCLGNWSSRSDDEYSSTLEDGGQYFKIDTEAPAIGTAVFVNETGDVRRTYESDMYLSGIQKLEIPVQDAAGIAKVEYRYAENLNDIETLTAVSSSLENPGVSNSDGAKFVKEDDEHYVVSIPVSNLLSASQTKLAIKVTVTKGNGSSTTSYERYVVNFDDTAPEIKTLSFNGINYDSEDSSTHKIVNSNGYFTIGGSSQDEGAGFDRMAFYFKRGTGVDERIYNPLNDNSRIDLAGLNTRTISYGVEQEITVYGKQQSLVIDNDGRTITGYSADTNVSKGSLVEIGGVWYKIASIEGSTITLATSTTVTGSIPVFFAYLSSLDNTETEKNDGATETSGDGDGMPESIIKSNTTWNYDAIFHSNYIPDGPITLYTIVWDKAGNVTAASYVARVENNAPRLTKLWLGTELSSNANLKASEFRSYDILDMAGKQASYVMNTADYHGKRYRVLGSLAVVAEFTGGNNIDTADGIGLAFNENPDADAKANKKDVKTADNWYTSDAVLAAKPFLYGSEGLTTTKWAYRIPASKLGDDSTEDATVEEGFTKRAMSFTFWDKTEETIQGETSCFAYLRVEDFIVLKTDRERPRAVIDPFYWTSVNENSLYKNSASNGHIELAKDIAADSQLAVVYDSGAGQTIDPKVSGKISIRGQAYDAHTLGSIWMHFDNFTAATKVKGAAAVESLNVAEDTYYKVAEYVDNGEGYTWKLAEDTVSGNKWNFSILEESKGQEGHHIYWQLDIDTNGISTGFLKNAKAKILVRDKAWSTVATAEKADHVSNTIADETAELSGTPAKYDSSAVTVPSYQMDVVPYITGITGASTRSRLGRYPIQTTGSVTINGWNFGTAKPTVYRSKTKAGDTVADEKSTDAKLTVNSNTVTAISVAAPANSGFIRAVWGDVSTINNINSTTAGYNVENGFVPTDADFGAEAANDNGTNFWTDDRYLSVWKVGTTFDASDNPYNGMIERAENATNKFYFGVDGTKGGIVDDKALFSIWGMDKNTVQGAMIDKKRDKSIGQNDYTNFGVIPDAFDVCVAHDVTDAGGLNSNDNSKLWNTPFYVILDNTNDNGNTFTTGLMAVRETDHIDKNSNSDVYGIESQGKDKMANQFRNLKIAASYNPAGTTENQKVQSDARSDSAKIKGLYSVYVSYYDAFSHCLKYASYDYTGNKQYYAQPLWNVRANSDENEAIVVGSSAKFTTGATDAGEWNDIKVDISGGKDNPIPVIIYYDKSNNALGVARGKLKSPRGTSDWSITSNINPTGGDFGRYCSFEMDDNGGLHVVAQDVDTASLYYGYAPKPAVTVDEETKKENNSTYSFTWERIDGTGSVGHWTDIKLEDKSKSGKAASPVISYINSGFIKTVKAIKVAYIVNGTWDAVTDPAVYEAVDAKTSIVTTPAESSTSSTTSNRLGVGFNSSMMCVDFLRDE